MADVRMPDGTIVRNVPDGITKSELHARVAKMGGGPSMVPAPEGLDIAGMARREVSQLADTMQKETPFLERMNARFAPGELAPLLGMGAAAMVPGAGWGSLLLSSALSGGVTTLGDMARQNIRGDVDVTQALKTGAKEGVANFAGGAALKTLGATSRALFHTELDDAAKAGVKFAREQGAPFPLFSAAPGSRAGRIQQGTRALLPGDIRTQVDANRVTTFLNQRVGTLTEQARPVDEAAVKGQQYLRQLFEPGESVYKNTWQKFYDLVGKDSRIATTRTKAVSEEVLKTLEGRGETRLVHGRIKDILNAKAETLSAKEFDNLYGGLIKDMGKNPEATPEVGRMLAAIRDDLDTFAVPKGMSMKDALYQAESVRKDFRALKDAPELYKLSKEIGTGRGAVGTRVWMAKLFANPNGKALAELRTRNPGLYHELADSWLASHLDKFSEPTREGFGRALNGQKLRAWFEQNSPNLKVILGSKQTQALDNFSLYAKHMTGAVERSVQGSRGMDPMAMLARGGAEATATVKQPWLMIPGEAASYVLAKGLSDPSSVLFKAFTEGFSPGTRSFVIKSGQLGAQASSKKANGEDSR